MDDKLYKFVRLIEAGTYTKAAEDLHISQPALTVAIQKLESQFKAELVVRSGKQLELTPAGKLVYQAAQDHQSISGQLHDTLEKLKHKRPSIVLGMIDSLADTLCNSAAFEQLEGAANVTLSINNSRFLREGVEKRTVTAAFVIDDELLRSSLTTAPVGFEQLQLVCHPDTKNTLETAIQSGVIDNFISYDRPSTTYRHISHFFAEHGIRTKTRLYSTSPNIMLSMVLAGKGCAVLPMHLCEPHIINGQLSTALGRFKRPLSLIHPLQATLPAPLISFIKDAESLLDT